MNQKNLQEHCFKETLKQIVDTSPNYSETMKRELKTIIDTGRSPEEIMQTTLLYFASKQFF